MYTPKRLLDSGSKELAAAPPPNGNSTQGRFLTGPPGTALPRHYRALFASSSYRCSPARLQSGGGAAPAGLPPHHGGLHQMGRRYLREGGEGKAFAFRQGWDTAVVSGCCSFYMSHVQQQWSIITPRILRALQLTGFNRGHRLLLPPRVCSDSSVSSY